MLPVGEQDALMFSLKFIWKNKSLFASCLLRFDSFLYVDKRMVSHSGFVWACLLLFHCLSKYDIMQMAVDGFCVFLRNGDCAGNTRMRERERERGRHAA